MHTGPNVTNDGLIFGYDTGYAVADNITPTRFYKGAPTTNPIYLQNAVAQNSYTTYSATSSGNWNANHPKAIRAYNAVGGEKSSYYNSGVGDAANTMHAVWELDTILNKPVVVMNDSDGEWKAKSFATGLGSWTSQGKGYGDTYTISWLQWVDNLSKNARAGLYTKNTGGSSGFHDGQATSAPSYNTKLRTWQRVYQTYTTANNRNLNDSLASIYMYGHYGPRAVVKVADVQWQWGSTPYPFVEGDVESRSNTDSLIDLKRTVDIDVSNMSFDSTSQPTFDGTDDILNTGLFSGRDSTDVFTIEAIVKSDTTSGSRMWVDATGNGSNQRLYCAHASTGSSTPLGIQGTGWSHSIPQDTNYHHYVITMNGSTAQLYDNSVAHSSKSYTSYTLSGQINVGGRSGYRWNGEIPVFKIYDKVLTTAEITQNYNAYKTRFNI